MKLIKSTGVLGRWLIRTGEEEESTLRGDRTTVKINNESTSEVHMPHVQFDYDRICY